MSDGAELSSIQSAVEELARRIEVIAERHDRDPDDPVATQLFEVERLLRTAHRQIERVRQRL